MQIFQLYSFFWRNTFFNSINKINGSMEGVNGKRLAVIIKANLRFRDLGLPWNLEIGLWLANSWKWCYFCLNLFPNFWLWSEMHWAGLMHTALAPASNSCIRLMHPPPLLPSPHPTSQANTLLVHFWRLHTHQGQGESLFRSSGIVSRLKFFTFCY